MLVDSISSCPETRTSSRPACAGTFRIDVSTLGSPMEARILGHEHADPALDIVGRRHRWLDPARATGRYRLLTRGEQSPQSSASREEEAEECVGSLHGTCDVASDWAACSVISTATPHRSLGVQAGRNGWPGGEVCSGSPIANPAQRRLVSANFENAY